MKQVIRYVADDGEMFNTEQKCIAYEEFHAKLTVANERFQAGASLAEVLRFLRSGTLPESNWAKHYTEFESATKDTLVAIPFWQCIEVPTYKIQYITKNLNLRVGNSAYSDIVYLHDFHRYLEYTNKNFK